MKSLALATLAVSLIVLAPAARAQQDGGQSGTAGTGFVSPTLRQAPTSQAAPRQLSDADRQRLERLLDRVNRPGPPLPAGPTTAPAQERVAPPSVAPTTPQGPPDSSQLNPPAQLFIYRNTSLGAAAPKSVINEPSADGYGNVVVLTGNWYFGVSQDAGASFSFLDPFSFMTGVDGGFCCDQVVAYDHSRDLLLGILMSSPSNSTQQNTLRLWVVRGLRSGIDYAVYSYDFVPQSVGSPLGQWLDFPKLVVGRNNVFLTANVFTLADSFVGSVVMRLPLDPIRDGAGFGFNFVQSALGTPTVAQGIGTVAYWASHLSLSSIRIFRWSDDSGSFFFFDRAVPAWSDATRSCPGPDGRDWCGRADSRILGAYLRDRIDGVDGKEVGFMWSSAAQDGRPMPYVRAVRFAVNGLALIDVPDIWNPSFAFIYPYAAPNVSGGLGLSLFFGGGRSSPSTRSASATTEHGDVGMYGDGGQHPGPQLEPVGRLCHGADQLAPREYVARHGLCAERRGRRQSSRSSLHRVRARPRLALNTAPAHPSQNAAPPEVRSGGRELQRRGVCPRGGSSWETSWGSA